MINCVPNRSLCLSYLFSAEINQAKKVEFGKIIFNLKVPANHHEIRQKVDAGNHGKIVATDISAY